MLPPRPVRRLVLAPLAVVVAIALIVLSPLLAIAALTFSLVRRSPSGRMRGVRLLFFTLAWLTAETATLFMCLGLWLASGFGGRMQTQPWPSRHYAVMRWFLDVIYRTAVAAFGLRVEVEEPELTAEEQAARLAGPVIVLSRHAGPGDSLLLVHHLLSVYGRRPRVVMKAAMQLDPSLDVVANRLPNVFIAHRQTGEGKFSDQIERLASGLDQLGALVIFPEGGNWTPRRWDHSVQKLEQRGRDDLAARARAMPNLLPPRTGGVLSAITACPEADVIFVAHAGLDTIATVGDVWRNLKIDQIIRAKWWRVPAADAPRSGDHAAQEVWLYDWWRRIDTWVSQNRPGDAETAPGALTRPASAGG
jgi:1-acyl-sn-glycerol-3-phosphate acyltransferase